MSREQTILDECQEIWNMGPGFTHNGVDYSAQVLQVLMLIGRELAALNDNLERDGS